MTNDNFIYLSINEQVPLTVKEWVNTNGREFAIDPIVTITFEGNFQFLCVLEVQSVNTHKYKQRVFVDIHTARKTNYNNRTYLSCYIL